MARPLLAAITGHFREDRPKGISLNVSGSAAILSSVADQIDAMVASFEADKLDLAAALAEVETVRADGRYVKANIGFIEDNPEVIRVFALIAYLERNRVIGGEYNGVVYLPMPSQDILERQVTIGARAPLDPRAPADVIWRHFRQACRLGRVCDNQSRRFMTVTMPDADVYDFGPLLTRKNGERGGYIGDEAYELLIAEAEADPPSMPSERCAFIMRHNGSSDDYEGSTMFVVRALREGGIEWTTYANIADPVPLPWARAETVRNTTASSMDNPIPVGLTLLSRAGPEVLVMAKPRPFFERTAQGFSKPPDRVQVLHVNRPRLIRLLTERAEERRKAQPRAKPTGYHVFDFWRTSKNGKLHKVKGHDRAGGPPTTRVFRVELASEIIPSN